MSETINSLNNKIDLANLVQNDLDKLESEQAKTQVDFSITVASLGGVNIENTKNKETEKPKNLTPEEAENLAKKEGKLTPEYAKALAKKRGTLNLSWLKNFDDWKSAEILAGHKGDLILSGLTTINEDVAAFLKYHEGTLDLSGLKKISKEVAKELCSHRGDLILSGITSMDWKTRENLRNHRGHINLSGLKNVDNKISAGVEEHEQCYKIIDDLKENCIKTKNIEIMGYQGKEITLDLPPVGDFKGFKLSYFISNDEVFREDIDKKSRFDRNITNKQSELEQKSFTQKEISGLLAVVHQYMIAKGLPNYGKYINGRYGEFDKYENTPKKSLYYAGIVFGDITGGYKEYRLQDTYEEKENDKKYDGRRSWNNNVHDYGFKINSNDYHYHHHLLLKQ